MLLYLLEGSNVKNVKTKLFNYNVIIISIQSFHPNVAELISFACLLQTQKIRRAREKFIKSLQQQH